MKKTLAALLLTVYASAASAGAVIGQWTGSSRSWNASDFSIIKATMTGGGHTVEGNEAISAANLANNDMFVIGEPTVALAAGETTDLLAWLNAGGVLWFGVDSGSNTATANGILSDLGSAMSIGSTTGFFGAALSSGVFASEGPPFNLVGQFLLDSLQRGPVAGGTILAGNMVHWEQIGAGYLFVSSDRFEQDFSNSTAASVNGRFFLNIAGFAEGANRVPEPGSLALLALGLAGLAATRMRRQ